MLVLYPDVRWQIPEKDFGGARAPSRKAVRPCVTTLIGVRKIVTAWSRRSAQSRKRPAVQPQRVTDIIEANGVGQLRKKHAHHVTPWTEGPRHGIYTGITRKFRNQMRRNQIANLSENAEFGCGWFGVSFFHLC